MTALYLKTTTFFFAVIAVSSGYASGGYSFAQFSGPVSGPETKIVHGGDEDGGGKYYHNHHKHSIDYIAKPDYHFAYGVEDPKQHLSHGHQESRHGDEVRGEYSVLDPDGVFRTVKYTADKHNGFQAQIITNGQGNSVSHHPAVKPVHEVHNDGGGSGSSSGGGSSNDGEEEDDGEENEIDDDDGGSDTSSEEEDGDDEYY